MRTPVRGAPGAHGPRPARVPYVAGRALWTATTIGRAVPRIAGCSSPERGQLGLDRLPHRLECRGVAAGDELDVAQDHEGLELEDDLGRIGGGLERAGRLRGRDLRGEQLQPAPAERHRRVADGPRMRVE